MADQFPSSSPGTLLFSKKITVNYEHEGPPERLSTEGVLSVFGWQSVSIDEQRLAIQVVLASNNERVQGIFHQSFDAEAAKTTDRSTELGSVCTLAELLDKASDKDRSGTYSLEVQMQDSGSTLSMSIHEHQPNNMVISKWKAEIRRSDPTAVLSLFMSLIDDNHQLREKVAELESENKDLLEDRNDCKDTMTALGERWRKEKSDMLQSFLELYQEAQNANHENAQQQDRQERMMMGARAHGSGRTRAATQTTMRATTQTTARAEHSTRIGRNPSSSNNTSKMRGESLPQNRNSKRRKAEVAGSDLDLTSEEDEAGRSALPAHSQQSRKTANLIDPSSQAQTKTSRPEKSSTEDMDMDGSSSSGDKDRDTAYHARKRNSQSKKCGTEDMDVDVSVASSSDEEEEKKGSPTIADYDSEEPLINTQASSHRPRNTGIVCAPSQQSGNPGVVQASSQQLRNSAADGSDSETDVEA